MFHPYYPDPFIHPYYVPAYQPISQVDIAVNRADRTHPLVIPTNLKRPFHPLSGEIYPYQAPLVPAVPPQVTSRQIAQSIVDISNEKKLKKAIVDSKIKRMVNEAIDEEEVKSRLHCDCVHRRKHSCCCERSSHCCGNSQHRKKNTIVYEVRNSIDWPTSPINTYRDNSPDLRVKPSAPRSFRSLYAAQTPPKKRFYASTNNLAPKRASLLGAPSRWPLLDDDDDY